MVEKGLTIRRKATIAPILQVDWEVVVDRPATLYQSRKLSIENISELLTAEHFNLWKQNLSENQRKQVGEAKIAVVHRFESSGHVGKEEQASKDLVDRVVACLRIIRPTRGRFQNIQLEFLNDGSTNVFRFTHPQDIAPEYPSI